MTVLRLPLQSRAAPSALVTPKQQMVANRLSSAAAMIRKACVGEGKRRCSFISRSLSQEQRESARCLSRSSADAHRTVDQGLFRMNRAPV